MSGDPNASANVRVKSAPACTATLPANSKYAITIVFTPFGIGQRSAALLVPSNTSNGTQASVLLGKGIKTHH